jgi:hypothetical protein
MAIGIFESLYDLLGKPSLISAGAAILSGFAVSTVAKNRSRNEFINDLMRKEKDECLQERIKNREDFVDCLMSKTLVEKSEITFVREEIKQFIELEKERTDNIKEQLRDIKETIAKTQESIGNLTFGMIKK